MPVKNSGATERPTIGITMGDAAGVGPELCLQVLSDPAIAAIAKLVVFGDAGVLEQCAVKLKLESPKHVVDRIDEALARTDSVVLDLKQLATSQFKIGQVNEVCGRASYFYIQSAIDAALNHQLDAITTAPINKEALWAAGIKYPGHTEMFAERAGSSRWCMMQYSPEITCTFVTVHVGYAEVPSLLSIERVLTTIELTVEALRSIRGTEPKLVVCGLNPHAGEHGLFGNREEERIIIPAIELARGQGINIEGPLPPDTAFLPAKRRVTDAFVCMYHDQGHIPLKALAFDTAVNTTLGLPIVRTSVDHGTAYDIAWKGEASCSSLRAALRLAVCLAKLRN